MLEDKKCQRKRRKYSEGLDTSSSKFSNNGVKKVLLLVVAPGVKEEYEIVNTCLSKLKFPKSNAKLVPDLKLANVGVGVGTASSTFPLAICGWRKGSTDRCTEKDLRTFQGIRKNHTDWVAAGAKKKDAKHFQNCIREPFSFFPKFGKVAGHIFLPSLHLKMGVTNKLMDEMCAEFEFAEDWGQRLHVVREDYHKQYEGVYVARLGFPTTSSTERGRHFQIGGQDF